MSTYDDEPRPLGPSLMEIRRKLREDREEREARGEFTGMGADPQVQRDMAEVQIELAGRRWAQVIPSRFQWARVEDFDGAAGEALTEWMEKPKRGNLVLFGATGTGKSHAAAAAVRASFEAGMEVAFWSVSLLLHELRPNGRADLRDVAEVDVLVLDDLGNEKGSDWTVQQIDMLVNDRWMQERPTIVTTNLDPKAVEEAFGPRLWSRLAGNDSLVLMLGGEDRRLT